MIYQENRSFDHYFGAYQPPGGGAVEGLLDIDGRIDPRFTGLQKNAAGAPYGLFAVALSVPGFANAVLENRPFHFSPSSRPEIMFRGTRCIISSACSRRSTAGIWITSWLSLCPARMSSSIMSTTATRPDDARRSTPSGAVLGFYMRDDLPDYYHLADEYVLFDHFFQAMSGGSTGNALYLTAARSAV